MNRLFEKFRTDLLGLFFLMSGLFVGLSLLSFNPLDPSFNSLGHGFKSSNWCGFIGGFLADALFQIWGVASWLFVPAFLRWGVSSLQGGAMKFRNLQFLWGFLLLLVFSSLSAVYFPETKLYSGQIPVGGLLGLALGKGLVALLNPIGVQIVLWSTTLVLTIFISEKSLKELAKPLPVGKLWKSLRTNLELPKLSIPSLPAKEKKKKLSEEPESAQKSPLQSPLRAFPVQIEMPLPEEPEEEAHASDHASAGSSLVPVAKRRKVVVTAKMPNRVENWKMPKVDDLIEDPPASRIKIDQNEIKEKARAITEKMALFDVTGEVTAAKPGPAVTMFEFKPESSVRVSKITDLEDDLSLELAAESLRILAPIPGRDVVGIETSNRHRETVYMKDMFAENKFWSDDITLPVALGRKVDGTPEIVDLRKMPHLMIAGTTGSGKSVFTVSTITGLIFRHSPKTLKLILIDPKQVDLAAFDRIPHLALPVVTDSRQAVLALKWAVREMEKRYKSMSKFGARKIEEYNAAVADLSKEQIKEHAMMNDELEQTPGKRGEMYYYSPLPMMVIVVEEFADLMTVDKAGVEQSVVRLAQKARACGIHLVLCLQSPRKEFVTGAIKSNIPGRIAFKAASGMESRIILDELGAERLLSTGDMLYRGPGSSAIIRHHGPFLKDSDIQASTKFWADQGEPQYEPSAMKALDPTNEGDSGSSGGNEFGEEEMDERYNEILDWAQAQKEVSASLIQRRFQLGYPRAARMIETFERQGIVGPPSGSKPRQVLIHNLKNLGA